MATKGTRASKIRDIEIANNAASDIKFKDNTVTYTNPTYKPPKKPQARVAAPASQRVKEFGGDNIETQINEWLASEAGVTIDRISYAYTSPQFHGALILYHTA